MKGKTQQNNEWMTNIIRHFSRIDTDCKMEDLILQPVEQIYRTDYKTKEEWVQALHAKEDWWIKTLWTLEPYGLNHKLNADSHTSDTPVLHKFNKIDRKGGDGGQRGQGIKKHTYELDFTPHTYFKHLINIHDHTIEWRNECRIHINRLTKLQANALTTWLAYTGEELYNIYMNDMITILKDLIFCKTGFQPIIHINKKRQDTKPIRYHVPFVNKGVQAVGLEKLLHHQELQQELNFIEDKDVQLMVVMSTKDPIRNTTLNYQKTQQGIKGNDWNKEHTYTCKCHTSKFCNKELGHVQTGNLEFVENESLRNVLSMGLNYVDPAKIDWELTKTAVTQGMGAMIDKWAIRESKDTKLWDGWKAKLNQLIDEQIKIQKQKMNEDIQPHLSNKELLQALDKLQEEYVLTATDKVHTNVSIICKQYYIRKQVNELEYNKMKTFERMNKSEEDLLEKMKTELKERFGITPELLKLASMYETSKNHKTPPAIRFITAAKETVLRELAARVDLGLKVVIQQLRKKCNQLHKDTGVRHMWFMDDVSPLLKYIKAMSGTKTARNVRVDDFPSMYNGIEHDELMTEITKSVTDAFNEAQSTYIEINGKRNTKFVDKIDKKYTTLTKEQLIEHIDYMVRNAYVKCGDRIYRQRIGIPMGMRPSPRIANLYLHQKEYRFITGMLDDKQTKQVKMARTIVIHRYFSACFRYQDDLFLGNNDNMMNKYGSNIYGKMIPVKQNKKETEAAYMNVKVSVQDGRYRTKTYDKKKDFDFVPIQFTHITSDTPDKGKHNIIIGQMITYARTCDTYKDFVDAVHFDMNVMTNKNGLNIKRLNHIVKKFVHSDNEHNRYGVNKYEMCKNLKISNKRKTNRKNTRNKEH
jgi:hypothetical protein